VEDEVRRAFQFLILDFGPEGYLFRSASQFLHMIGDERMLRAKIPITMGLLCGW
jgi:hypothetical protein